MVSDGDWMYSLAQTIKSYFSLGIHRETAAVLQRKLSTISDGVQTYCMVWSKYWELRALLQEGKPSL
jgi:hypothetical protein